VCAMLDARRDQVYMGVYEFIHGKFVPSLADCAVGIHAVLDSLPRSVFFVGDGARVHQEQILTHLGNRAYFAGIHLGRPEAGSIALLGGRLIEQGFRVDLETLEPQYLRASQAEQVREARLAKG
ncbi:MAG: tRNA (adenosine(37)-N6)-threonylcarbamoyltransferase complex dimerization subunit type 1 TsaB, partial [Candidatus Latescibacteria bacterium]|nr:tRNA (adenosine(37)-N6)-threonylcarbamoyltransferase complex dimerization subunit type 1 TsaB [Candidatus Latescibacterota bacterium]